MFEKEAADATAFALERRNFDFLPDDQAASWRREFLATKRIRVAGPQKLIVELLNSCNLDCPMCRVGQHGINLSRAMPLQVFERVIAALPSVQAVRLNGLGESTLLPDFRDYVAALRRAELAIELITNASGPLAAYGDILSAGGHVLVSWDAAQPVIFEQLRRPARWTDYVERLGNIAATATESRAGRCSLIFTQQKRNIGELAGVVALAGRLGITAVQINVAKTPSMHWATSNWESLMRDMALAARNADRLGVALYIPNQIAGINLDLTPQHQTAGRGCGAPWEEVVVRWNGDVQTCNMFNPFTYGNIHRDALGEIWDNHFASLFRAKLNGADRHPYCRDCSYMPSAYR